MIEPPTLSLDQDPPHPAEHKLLSRTVADWLAELIISGEEVPGSRLTETDVARRAGVSRSPVREALRILEGEGLVQIAPRYGAQVARVGIDDVRTRMERAVANPVRFLNVNVDYFRTLVIHCPNETLRELVELTWKKAV